jgi:hypothetical protein
MMELLKQLYSIHVPTFHEWPLICFIRHFITTEHHRFPHIFKTYTQQMIESEYKQ